LPVGIPRDVLSEERRRPDFSDDSSNMLDEEPIIVGTGSFAGHAVGLARITGSDAMNAATERSTVEGGKVRPDRRRSQVTRFHARSQKRGGSCVPLHVSDATRSRHGELEGKPEPA
jgi:hypothetical protein